MDRNEYLRQPINQEDTMYCVECGKEISNDSVFCNYCGESQEPGLNWRNIRSTPGTRWETCEIRYVSLGSKRKSFFSTIDYKTFKFVAEAIGPSGSYVIGETSTFTVEQDGESGYGWLPSRKQPAIKHFEVLVASLFADGWEQTGAGDTWFNLKFRRHVK